jgi:hypothetical protein
MILGPPEQIDAAVLAFCATIAPARPAYVRVDPQPDTRVAYCFDNSEAQARLHGGEAVYGWAIWHWPGRWFEAEHHAVWRKPDGELVDVTPQAGDPSRILFLPDPSAPYDPSTFRRNVMAPDTANPDVAEYLALVAQRRDIIDPYWYPGCEILPLFSPADRMRLQPIEARMAELIGQLRGMD